MKEKLFNWDKYFSNASWDEVRENSPMLSVHRLPSQTIRERGIIYISSLDLDFSISDTDSLENIIPEVKDNFRRAKESNDYYKMGVAHYDFEEIKILLSNHGIERFDSIEV